MSYFAHAEVAVPTLNARVTDLTHTLTAEQKAHLEQKLSALEQTQGSQVAILIIPTTKPESIEGFSLRVVDEWKLGRKEVDDGVLLTIAKNDRKMRIEVGDGLEGAITDVSAGRIISEYITPEFRQGRFYEGILAGTGQIENLIKGEPLPAPSTNQGNDTDGSIFMIFAASFITPFLTSLLGRILTVSSITAVGATFIWFSSQSVEATIFGAISLAFFSFAFSSPQSSSYRGGGHGGGFGGSGGGFSGGGGGFSGGGASGDW